MSFLDEFNHLRIQLQDIISATENFSSNKLIGRGGFGRVYKGELSLPEGKTMVAFKRLDRRLGQGSVEFWKEIVMLSRYRHENLVSLMHFCDEGDEMILLYEYASRGSLDCYLSDTDNLTWIQRLKICVGVARGLKFLHDPVESQQRVIHRDIKSGNILLDEKWTAKVSDFGLSKLGPANQLQTFIVSNAVATPGYCDPLYWETGFLSKESDVYSFGVVLFEVLCGRLCFDYSNGELSNILVPKWRRCYEDKRLDEIILVGLQEQMEPGSLDSFSAIAYQCVKKDREERPVIAEVLKELEFALKQQEIFENLGKKDIAELIKIADLAVPPLSYGSNNQLLMLLLKGFRIDDGKTWVSINMNGEVTKVVSATKCFLGDNLVTKNAHTDTAPNKKAKIERCKFPYYVWNVYSNRFRVEVDSRFLSLNVTYTIYIVFKYCGRSSPKYIPFEYKLDGETVYSRSCIAYAEEDDGWLVTKLYQFTSQQGTQNFSINFLSRRQVPLDHEFGFEEEFAFEGIEFRPLENTGRKQMDKVKMETDSEPNFLSDFTDLIALSKDYIQWTTKKELYFLLRKGFLIDGDKWLSISKKMKKRLMIPASTFLDTLDWNCNSVPESDSRFKVVTKSLKRYSFEIRLKVDSKILSPQTKYSCHLIFKLPNIYSSFEGPMVIGIDDGYKCHLRPLSICLNTRCHPPIIGSHDNKSSCSGTLHTCKMKGHPKQRKDGWLEVQLSEVSVHTIDTVYKSFVEEKKFRNTYFFGIVIEGIEFRPL